jgi:hypothetical protein
LHIRASINAAINLLFVIAPLKPEAVNAAVHKFFVPVRAIAKAVTFGGLFVL